MTSKTNAEMLRELRAQLGLSQSQFAQLIRTNKFYVQNIEQSKRRVDDPLLAYLLERVLESAKGRSRAMAELLAGDSDLL